MVFLVSSANDPAFFLHHSFIDYIWETWRQGKQPRQNRESDYPRDDIRCNSAAHFARAPMLPFSPMLNIDGLSNEYTVLYMFHIFSIDMRNDPLAHLTIVTADQGTSFAIYLTGQRSAHQKLYPTATVLDSFVEKMFATGAHVGEAPA
ncbi:unnamed protein product [Cylicostephanus goldi]|uniref:Tyrosinase copper-binding domain-containing protein n=1 Tax=Cylicostephanus goldi TaxID=71465 RepID=A0A3P6QFS8_CYLGO|nr:unnamed protein product [Cylicostephanus goldi]